MQKQTNEHQRSTANTRTGALEGEGPAWRVLGEAAHQVELDDLRAVDSPSVLDRAADAHPAHLQAAVGEVGVRKPVAKGVLRADLVRVVPAIPLPDQHSTANVCQVLDGTLRDKS